MFDDDIIIFGTICYY